MLPEAMAREMLQDEDSKKHEPALVAMKFQHYGDQNNCLIRPGEQICHFLTILFIEYSF